MRNSTVKYSGAFTAIIGFFILAFLGANYAWDEARSYSAIDMNDYWGVAIFGMILLGAGIGLFIVVEE